jgi:serine/threonine protein kinase
LCRSLYRAPFRHQLGHGTQGVVILARDKLKEKLVAIKEVRMNLVSHVLIGAC